MPNVQIQMSNDKYQIIYLFGIQILGFDLSFEFGHWAFILLEFKMDV
jgi:hypothetical protein